MEFEIIYYRPSRNIVVAERPDGRQYDVEISTFDGKVCDVLAVGGKRRVCVDGTKIGLAIAAEVNRMIAERVEEFFIYDYDGVREKRAFVGEAA